VERQQKWGAVRTLARVLAWLDARGLEEEARLLAERGGDVVCKLAPELDASRPAAWVVAAPETLRALHKDRNWRDPSTMPEAIRRQLAPEALAVLQSASVEAFLDAQDRAVLECERRVAEGAGLIVQAPTPTPDGEA
jgi:hypothetical protein